MKTTKLNDWLQIAAAVGVIAGLVLVAYEIRVSNRIGIEQANATRFEKWTTLNEQALSPGVANLFVRSHEGEKLTRSEAVELRNLIDTFLISLNYVFVLVNTQSIEYPTDFSSVQREYIQFYMGSEYGRRFWEVIRNDFTTDFALEIDKALAAPEQLALMLQKFKPPALAQ